MTEDHAPYEAGSRDLTDPDSHAEMMGECGCTCKPDPHIPVIFTEPPPCKKAEAVFKCRFGDLHVVMHPSGDQEVTITYKSPGGTLHIDRISNREARISLSPPSKEPTDASDTTDAAQG